MNSSPRSSCTRRCPGSSPECGWTRSSRFAVTGWAWVGMLGYGDFINFIGIAFLAGVSIICYIAIIPTLLKSGDRIYAIIAILEVIVLTAAAAGIFGSGGH